MSGESHLYNNLIKVQSSWMCWYLKPLVNDSIRVGVNSQDPGFSYRDHPERMDPLKMDPLKMYFLLKMGIFHGYVSLPEGTFPKLGSKWGSFFFKTHIYFTNQV